MSLYSFMEKDEFEFVRPKVKYGFAQAVFDWIGYDLV